MAEAPPLSIRLGPERSARVERHMARKGLTIRAAVVDLVDVGLKTVEEVAPDGPWPVLGARKTPPPGYQPGAVTAEALRRLKETPDHD